MTTEPTIEELEAVEHVLADMLGNRREERNTQYPEETAAERIHEMACELKARMNYPHPAKSERATVPMRVVNDRHRDGHFLYTVDRNGELTKRSIVFTEGEFIPMEGKDQ